MLKVASSISVVLTMQCPKSPCRLPARHQTRAKQLENSLSFSTEREHLASRRDIFNPALGGEQNRAVKTKKDYKNPSHTHKKQNEKASVFLIFFTLNISGLNVLYK